MTRLECTAVNCIHNAEKHCCKREIQVEGNGACKCGETCCGSFEENRGTSFKNIFKTPESKLQVECDATGCLYNDDRQCRAEKITINGSGAKSSGQTECRSFRSR